MTVTGGNKNVVLGDGAAKNTYTIERFGAIEANPGAEFDGEIDALGGIHNRDQTEIRLTGGRLLQSKRGDRKGGLLLKFYSISSKMQQAIEITAQPIMIQAHTRFVFQ